MNALIGLDQLCGLLWNRASVPPKPNGWSTEKSDSAWEIDSCFQEDRLLGLLEGLKHHMTAPASAHSSVLLSACPNAFLFPFSFLLLLRHTLLYVPLKTWLFLS